MCVLLICTSGCKARNVSYTVVCVAMAGQSVTGSMDVARECLAIAQFCEVQRHGPG